MNWIGLSPSVLRLRLGPLGVILVAVSLSIILSYGGEFIYAHVDLAK